MCPDPASEPHIRQAGDLPSAAPRSSGDPSSRSATRPSQVAHAGRVARPLASTDSTPIPPLRDEGLRNILLANAITLALAVWQDWSVLQLLWPFWMQSLIIGWYARRRILQLTRFCTKGVKINDRPVDPTPETQRSTANFFALHFGLFHLIYFFFLVAFTLTSDPQGFIEVTNEGTGRVSRVHIGKVYPVDVFIYLGLAWGFWRTHRASHREHVAADLGNTPNIGTLMGLPYARVVPMHLCILLSVPLGGTGAIWFFMLLKTGADAVMHMTEHRLLQGQEEAEPAR